MSRNASTPFVNKIIIIIRMDAKKKIIILYSDGRVDAIAAHLLLNVDQQTKFKFTALRPPFLAWARAQVRA